MAKSCDIDSAGEGTFILRGELSFATVSELAKKSAGLLWRSEQVTLDLDGVTRTDSAGLALLVEWLRAARRQGKAIQFRNIPRQMMAVAEVVGLDKLLPVTT